MNLFPTLAALAAPLFLGLVFAAADAEVTAPLLPWEPGSADLARARQVLDQWENTAPEKAVRKMQVVYWTPADREPQPDYRARLTRVMLHVQKFYLDQMTAYGFPGRSIQLDLADDGLLRLPVARGTLKSAECSEQDGSDGQAIRRDCLAALQQSGIDGNKETMVIFCNLAEWDAEQRRMSHHSPYYASGSSVGGTAWQLDSPLLDAASLPVKDQLLHDAQYGHISLGKYNSIFVGGVCHELGHALGLPHCRECAAAAASRGSALMGSGNRTYGDEVRGDGKGSFLTLPHALKLAAHPQFSGSVKQMTAPAGVDFSAWKIEPHGDTLQVQGRVASALPVHAVLAYADPEGGGDYDSAIAAAVPQTDGTFFLTLPATGMRSLPAMLSFVGVCANGAATASVWSRQALSLPCRIDAAGNYDVTPAMASLEIQEHGAAAKGGKLSLDALEKLTPLTREVFRRLALPDHAREKPVPAAVPDTVKLLPLSDAAPQSARTGYGGVHIDRTDAGLPLTGPEGPAAHGLWAHADSEYTYEIGGKWSTLRGSCALVQTGSGPVKAAILLDGKAVWESKTIKPGTVAEFSIDLKGAGKVTLKTTGERGIANAHSAWLEPVLAR